eukprot:TRINITY_DN15429_c0_g1_i1.p1 TRINITY_DN15429_c0_g1~~TRINITY_DN15429_c0_g1_i1.p1  ORF type:complete len:451 (-),score=86.69 TRINITY_DN15429_c0_g1_i1:200-1552(-)
MRSEDLRRPSHRGKVTATAIAAASVAAAGGASIMATLRAFNGEAFIAGVGAPVSAAAPAISGQRLATVASKSVPHLATESSGSFWPGYACAGAATAMLAAASRRSVRRRRATCNRKRGDQVLVSLAAINERTVAEPPAGASISLFSPAKVNLFLRVMRRRDDGYHELASLFHTIGLGDTLDLTVLPEGAVKDELECNLPGVPTDDSNFVIKALQLFREKSGVKSFFHVNLDKQIPAQAGMGGGSGNAATAFFGANALCGYPASPEQLLSWADDPVIGSDAAFFLSQGAAYCTGRGEIVTPVEPLHVRDDLPVYLIKPNYGLSTPKVFNALDMAQTSPHDPEELLRTFREHGVEHTQWVNDLEKPAFTVCPELGELKKFLEEDWGFDSVLMSGSGTTIFCLGEPRGGKDALEAAVRQRFDIENVWRSRLLRRDGGEAWYGASVPATSAATR